MALTKLVEVGIRGNKEELAIIVSSLLVIFVASADGRDVAFAVRDWLFHCPLLEINGVKRTIT